MPKTTESNFSHDAPKSPNIQSLVWMDEKYVYKLARSLSLLAEHEAHIGQRINSFVHPNFMKFISIKPTITKLDMSIYRDNPDDKKSPINPKLFIADRHKTGVTCMRPVTCWELLHGCTLVEFISRKDVSDKVVAGCIVQVIFAILEMQTRVGYVHGDLHCGNVMIVESQVPTLTYRIHPTADSTDDIVIPTYGYMAKIIDFGNSMCWYDENLYLTTPLYGYYAGATNLFFDLFNDLRVFLDACQFELFNARKSNMVGEFQRLTANILTHYHQDQGKIPPRDDIYDDLHQMFSKCNGYLGKQGSVLIQDKSMMDMLLTTVPLPVDFDVRIEDAEFIIDSAFTKQGIFSRFLKSWVEIERLFTKEQAALVFKEVVLFVHRNRTKTDSKVEAKFNALIHEQLKLYGQTMISVTLYDTDFLFHQLALLQRPLMTFIHDRSSDYLESIDVSTVETINTLQRVSNGMTPVKAFASIIKAWWDRV